MGGRSESDTFSSKSDNLVEVSVNLLETLGQSREENRLEISQLEDQNTEDQAWPRPSQQETNRPEQTLPSQDTSF